MTPGQHNPAMVDLGGKSAGLIDRRQASPLDQCAAACGTPVRGSLQTQHGVAVGANAFHSQILLDLSGTAPNSPL
jgi:hypothetical protein